MQSSQRVAKTQVKSGKYVFLISSLKEEEHPDTR